MLLTKANAQRRLDTKPYTRQLAVAVELPSPAYRHSPPACAIMGQVCLLPVDENILIALVLVAVAVLTFVALLQPPPLRRGFFR